MYATFASLIPFLVVIPIAVFTKQVLPGLLVGLFVGAYMLHPTPLGGIDATLGYILKELAVADNLRLIVFLYGFGAFVGLVRVTGGVHGFAQWMSRRIQTVRGAFAVTWLSSIATFMAPDFRIITVAPVMKSLFQRLGVSTERVALMIDITATPLCAIVPIGTAFVGYMVGLIGTSARHHELAAAPFHTFLLSIPFNLFAWLMLAYGLFITFRKTEPAATGTMANHRSMPIPVEGRLQLVNQFAKAETGMELAPRLPSRAAKKTEDKYVDPVEILSENVSPRVLNLLIPIGLLLVLTLVLTWWSGAAGATGFFNALARANAAKAMLEALLITLVISMIWYSIQREPMQRTLFGILQGGNEMMGVNVLLVLVWAVSAVSNDLGFTEFTGRTIGHLVPGTLIAPVLFVCGCVLSYVIGSSFGTWGLLLPIGFSLAAGTHANLALIAGAVFASGTFGGFASPLSDNTVAMSTVMKLPLMRYAHIKLKPALWVAGLCTILYAVIGFLPGL